MTSKRILKYPMILLLLLTMAMFPGWNDQPANAFSNQILRQGSTGPNVIELQARLQYVGYYKGNIDGVFGWGTYWAVRNFQYKNRIGVDGIVGAETRQVLTRQSKYYSNWVWEQLRNKRNFTHYGGIPLAQQTEKGTAKQRTTGGGAARQPQPTAVNVPNGFSQNDIKLMSNAVYGEARGEPYVGQVAVAAVILNRVNSPTFPNTVSGVIFEPRAFTAVADGQIWLTPNDTARKAVLDAINGWDPSGDATYYFNPDTATSGWIWGRPQIKKIGKHIFCN